MVSRTLKLPGAGGRTAPPSPPAIRLRPLQVALLAFALFAGAGPRAGPGRLILPPGDWLAVRGMPLGRAGVLTCLALSGSGGMARIVDHLPVAALEARYRAAREVTEARHYQAIWLLAQGRSFLE